MANTKNKKYNKAVIKTAINILIFVLFILPAIIALYLVLFKFDLTYGQFNSLFCLFMLGLSGLAINNLSEL